MKIRVDFVFSAICLILAGINVSAEPITIHGHLSGEYYNNNIQKNTTRSFLNPGDFYLSNYDLSAQSKTSWGEWDASMRGRSTSDTRIDNFGLREKNFHVLDSRLGLRSNEILEAYRRRWEVDLAQFSEFYTPWSISQKVLGGRATYRWDNGYTARAGGGRVNEVEHNQQWDRYAAFGRIEKEDVFGWDLMVHGSGAWDNPTQLQFFANRPADQAAAATGIVAHSDFLEGKLNVDLEHDWSFHQTNRTVSNRALQGLASRLNLVYGGNQYRVTASGDRVTRDYNSLIGFASQDLIIGRASINGDPWDWLQYDVRYSYQEDNIEQTKTTTTRTQNPDVSYTTRPWLKSEHELARNLRWKSGAGFFITEAGDKSVDMINSTYRSGFDDRIGNLSFGVDYQYRFSDNRRLAFSNQDQKDNVIAPWVRHEGVVPFLQNRPYRVQVRYSNQWTKDILTGFKDKTNQVALSSFVNLYDNLDWNLEASFVDANKGRPRTDNSRKSIDTRLDYRFDYLKTKNRLWAGYRYGYSQNDDRTQDVIERVARVGAEVGF